MLHLLCSSDGVPGALHQVEAMMKANHERAADAHRALLPALHRDMLKPAAGSAATNGSGLPEIQVSVANC